MHRKNLEIIARVRRTEAHRARLIAMLRDSETALASTGVLHKPFYSSFGISNEVVIIRATCSKGNRPGTLWATFNHICYSSK